MVRKKAGYQEEHRKVIRQVDVLNALELSEVEDLLPCPTSLADVGDVVAREQLGEAIVLIPALIKPLLVHAEGGFGKTVFLESLASALSEDHEVVFFDCFGGGAYRSPEDGRHLANRGLIHIANVVACRGLCDPILPGSDNAEMLFSRFRKRLEQCVKALGTASPDRELILFIDAIDNAAEYASERKQHAFPTQLIESFELSGPVQGVKLVLSSRTHRIPIALPDLSYQDFALRPFTIDESRTYLRARLPSITETEVHVAQSRSAGNARILEHLVTGDRGLLAPSETDNPIALDDLLQQRIDSAASRRRMSSPSLYRSSARRHTARRSICLSRSAKKRESAHTGLQSCGRASRRSSFATDRRGVIPRGRHPGARAEPAGRQALAQTRCRQHTFAERTGGGSGCDPQRRRAGCTQPLRCHDAWLEESDSVRPWPGSQSAHLKV